MYIPQHAKVITIGDGDLSFSRALLAHVQPNNLVATTYDSESTLRSKYKYNALDDLINAGVSVHHNIDITDTTDLAQQAFKKADIVIFNHPLVPTQRSYAQHQKLRDKSTNLLNRTLLNHFLKNSFSHLLDTNGERLCYITTKSVKPYSHWHIETSLTLQNSAYRYLGCEAFDLTMFKNYQVRNVDRDKCVKHEASDIYVYSDNPEHSVLSRLTPFKYAQADHCPLCRKGPFANIDDWQLHTQTRIHKAQQQYSDAWVEFINKQ